MSNIFDRYPLAEKALRIGDKDVAEFYASLINGDATGFDSQKASRRLVEIVDETIDASREIKEGIILGLVYSLSNVARASGKEDTRKCTSGARFVMEEILTYAFGSSETAPLSLKQLSAVVAAAVAEQQIDRIISGEIQPLSGEQIEEMRSRSNAMLIPELKTVSPKLAEFYMRVVEGLADARCKAAKPPTAETKSQVVSKINIPPKFDPRWN